MDWNERYYGDEDDQRWEAERMARDEAQYEAEQARLAEEEDQPEDPRPAANPEQVRKMFASFGWEVTEP